MTFHRRSSAKAVHFFEGGAESMKLLDYRRDTHCPRGHDLREPGVLYETPSTGKRHCGECRRDKDRERKRAAVRRKKT